MDRLELYGYLFGTFSFLLGAAIGSFLNVCIYRMPLGLSVNNPKRSFCPSCKKQIPWHQNLPLVSWLALRGRCANCGCRIPFRYFGVELLTAFLFLAVWLRFQPPEAWLLVFPYWIFVSLLIVATFVDLEHFIIPDEITIGGTVAGIVLSIGLPALMGAESPLMGCLWSVVGAATGFALLFVVVEGGKVMFGKRRLVFDPPAPFSWVRHGDDAELKVGEEVLQWSEIFSREKDRLRMHCKTADVDGKSFPSALLEFSLNQVKVGGEEFALDQSGRIDGLVKEVVIPREAMGFGDVKFIAAIGAFLGWQAVFFTVVSASCVGAVVGVLGILFGKREWSSRIPFGPYLALGALIWMFCGREFLHWYLRALSPPETGF